MIKRVLARAFNYLCLILSLLFFAYYLLNGILIRFGQSLLFLWPIMGGLLLTRFILYERHYIAKKPLPFPKPLLTAVRIAVAACLVFFIAIEGVILSAAFVTPPEGLDYIIVLGAKVNGTSPSGALRNRIETAANYLSENPGTRVIASGGQGPDEGISEAECIRRGLVQRGISADRILMEAESTSTSENILFSTSLIEEKSASVGVVTNNFHVYRAMKITEGYPSFTFFAVPVPTSLFSFPHYMLREFCATVVGYLTGAF